MSNYDAKDIEVLTGLDPVRKRPGMYTDTSRPNHLAQEVIDNIAENIASALSSGDEQSANQLIDETNLAWASVGWISRASELPLGLSSLAFTLAKTEEGRHTYSAESANQLTSLVIDLAGVRVPEGDSDTGISSLYLSQENNEMFFSLIKQLRETAEIKVFSDLL